MAAAASAAHGVLAASFPDQADDLAAKLEASPTTVRDGPDTDAGIAIGEAAAAAMLAERQGDGGGGEYPMTYWYPAVMRPCAGPASAGQCSGLW